VRIEQQPAHILHARSYRETSLLLEAFTRDHGRIGLVARGVRRERARFPRAFLQPLQPISLDWFGQGELVTLAGVEATAGPYSLTGDALLCAMYVNELLLRLTARNDPHPEVHEEYSRCLERLTNSAELAWTLRRFERDFLMHLGFGLVLDHEPDSGLTIRPDTDYSYHAEHGPREWNEGSGGLRVPGALLLDFAHDRIPESRGLGLLRRLLRGVIAHHLGGASLTAWRIGQTSLRSTE
jgi:DNA repair protein RecO (recombination protein O)